MVISKPLIKWLKDNGVGFQMGYKVTDYFRITRASLSFPKMTPVIFLAAFCLHLYRKINHQSPMKNNKDLANDVAAAIKWEPIMSGTDIHVTALDGVVTLNGIVDGNLKKYKAEMLPKVLSALKPL